MILFPASVTSQTATLIDHIYYYEGTKTSDNVGVKAGIFCDRHNGSFITNKQQASSEYSSAND